MLNKKYFIAGFVLLFLIFSVGILFNSKRYDQNEEGITEQQIVESEEDIGGDEQGEKSGSSDEEFEKEKSYSENAALESEMMNTLNEAVNNLVSIEK